MSGATPVARRSLPLIVAATVLTGGLGISITAFYALRSSESAELQARFEKAVAAEGRRIEASFRSIRGRSYALGPRLESLRGGTPLQEQFSNTIRPRIDDIPQVLAVTWVPKVEVDRRTEHEDAARSQGGADYRIRTPGPDGDALPQIAGTALFPIRYIEPHEEHSEILGLDLRSIPAAAQAMDRSLEIGRSTLSPPFRWSNSDSETTAIMAVRPMIRDRTADNTRQETVENLVGFFAVIQSLEATLTEPVNQLRREEEREPADSDPVVSDTQLDATDFEQLTVDPQDEVDVLLSYVGDDDVARPAAFYASHRQTIQLGELDAQTLLDAPRPALSARMQGIADGWLLQCVATPKLVNRYKTWQPLAALIFGIVLTLGLAVYARVVLLRQQEFKQLMDRESYLLNALMDNIPDAVYFKDEQSRFLRISRAQADKFGFASPEEAIGKTDAEIFTAEHAQSALKDERDIMRTGRPMVARLEKETWSDREDTWVSSTKMPLYDSSGCVVGTFGISRDVTELKRTQDALLKARDAANAANQAKSNFLAVMSHEIRTPMNAIIGMTELLLDTRLDATQRDYLTIVVESAESLLSLINQILDFSKIEAGKLELEMVDFGLREEVGGTLKSLGLRAHGKDLELAWHVASGIPEDVKGDPGRLRQVLVNLVGNSIKFTHEGEIVVDVSLQEQDDEQVVLHFEVRDTGIGIPPEKHEAIFSAFEQADSSTTRQFGGTGLGLAIAQRIVEAMGGRIWVESTPGQGSQFHFTVAFQLGQRRRSEEFPDLSDLDVLVVDDNETNRRILEESLQNWGLSVELVVSGPEALETLRMRVRRGEPLPLVISDVNMPQMDGFELTEQIRADEALKDAIVIILTSGGRQGDIVRCEELGVVEHLMKPVRQSELLEALARAAGRRSGDVAAQPSSADDDVELPPLSILLAEDGLANQKMAVGLLEKWGHAVTVAENGEQAVSLWKSGNFDAILMDVQMPVVDGLEATRRIRQLEQQHGPDERIPIIAMTARAMKGDREMCLEAGMDDYVSKPVRRSELSACLARLCQPTRVEDRSKNS